MWLALQLVFVGGGFVCPMGGVGAAHGAAPATMASMPDMPAGHQHGTPCRLPWAPAGCSAATSCMPAAVTAAPVTVHLPAPAPERAAELVVLAPLSRTIAPDFPPPRA